MSEDDPNKDSKVHRYKAGETPEPTDTVKIVSYIVVGLVALAVIWLIVAFVNSYNEVSKSMEESRVQEQSKQEDTESKPDVNTDDLDLTISATVFGLSLANNERGELKNCEVEINPGVFSGGYKLRSECLASAIRLRTLISMNQFGCFI